MKRFIIILLLTLAYQSSILSQGIEFLENLPLKQILQKAKTEDKLVFVDCYTSWCGPCKKLARDIFPLKEAGDFFNTRFVSLKLDMEKGEGPEMAKQWDINAYPTLTFLDASGEVLFQTLGARDVKHLVDTVAYLLENHRPSQLAQRYKDGERSPELVAGYIAELNQQRKHNTIKAVAGEFVADNRERILTDSILQKILIDNVSDPYNDGFLYAYEHRSQLSPKMNEAMEFTWKLHTKSYYIMGEGDSLGLDEERMNAYYEYMKTKGVDRAGEYYYSYKLPASFLIKDKRMILECLEGCRNLRGISRGQIDMAFKALEELQLTEAEQNKVKKLKHDYSTNTNNE